MKYQLTLKSNSYLEIKLALKEFYLIPCGFRFSKRYPEGINTYKKVIDVSFWWLFWKYELLIRKPRKK